MTETMSALPRPALSEPMVRARVEALSTRSVKADAQAAAWDLSIACMDLTTLEGADTPGRVARLAARAVLPDPEDPTCPSVAAVCVYPTRVADARAALDRLGGGHVAVASVASGFPAGLTPREARMIEITAAVADGASEIDTVLDRAAFLSGDLDAVAQRIVEEKAACGPAKLKVILETAELGSPDAVWRAAWLAARSGADVLKTSTGKGPGGADLVSAWVLATVARDAGAELDRIIGVKISGGVRTAKDAVRYLLVVDDVAGPEALVPSRFRFGASGLLDDLVAQRRFHTTGRYHGPAYFPEA
jgi:deoxyribose-phosphate aldolase